MRDKHSPTNSLYPQIFSTKHLINCSLPNDKYENCENVLQSLSSILKFSSMTWIKVGVDSLSPSKCFSISSEPTLRLDLYVTKVNRTFHGRVLDDRFLQMHQSLKHLLDLRMLCNPFELQPGAQCISEY